MSQTVAQPVMVVREAALRILNRDSLYAPLLQSRRRYQTMDPEEEEDYAEAIRERQ